jgi:hypothetical protein
VLRRLEHPSLHRTRPQLVRAGKRVPKIVLRSLLLPRNRHRNLGHVGSTLSTRGRVVPWLHEVDPHGVEPGHITRPLENERWSAATQDDDSSARRSRADEQAGMVREAVAVEIRLNGQVPMRAGPAPRLAGFGCCGIASTGRRGQWLGEKCHDQQNV